jgi:hypothetical protein
MAKRERFVTRIPVSNDGRTMTNVVINVPRPMTQSEWDQLRAVLDVMKTALVEEAPDDHQ